MFVAVLMLSTVIGAYPVGGASAAITCEREVTADVVAFDKPIMYNRLGAGNVNGMMYALSRDVVNVGTLAPLTVAPGGAVAGEVDLRPDKRQRPLILRVRVGDCLTVNLTNLLTPAANPFKFNTALEDVVTVAGQVFPASIDEQVASRVVGFHVSGMQLVNGIDDDSSMVGRNHLGLPGSQGTPDAVNGSMAGIGQTRSYKLYAEKEGAFPVKSDGATFGSDANQGQSSTGLFGQVIVGPRGSAAYRGQVFEEEMRLSADANRDGVLTGAEKTAQGHPVLDYEAVYPATSPWTLEGKAGLPVLNMMKATGTFTGAVPNVEIVHSEINAVVAYGPNGATTADGIFPPSTYPLESVGKRNPSIPNRLEPFREFAQVWHDEPATAQAFPAFYVGNPIWKYVLAGVKDGFMINYGSGGIGSEIIANRLGVGPMHDCLTCAYEEFFLTSFTVGDPAITVDVPANVGLETCVVNPVSGALEGDCAGAGQRKANYVIGGEDPANIHHSYTGDFAKFRNTHIGKEQHVFHLHNHQWLYNPNDDGSNYLDAQGVGPGVGYTYEINFGGSGNRNKSAGDAIFHCHFYPHFAQGMWYHWRHNDVFQSGTLLAVTPNDGAGNPTGYHLVPWDLKVTIPAPVTLTVGGVTVTGRARAYPDGEIETGTAIPAVVPLPGKPMAVMPGPVPAATVLVVPKLAADNVTVVGSNAKVIDRASNPGFPFWVAGIEDVVGQRPPTPPLDMLTPAKATALKASGGLWANIDSAQADGWDGGLPRHALQGFSDNGAATTVTLAADFSKVVHAAKPVYFPEEGTDLEQAAMAFHAKKFHATYLPNGTPLSGVDNGFRTNGGGGPVVGAPYHNPCIDDEATVLGAGVLGKFFSGETAGNPMSVRGRSVFNSDTPRIYKGTNLQFDVVLNKVGYHYPQQRIVALWEDVAPIIRKNKAPEPLVMRLNTFDCGIYHHSNLVPEVYEMDDYQVRTPTDIIGQHIHLPKWDLTTTDGAANGWNYEDGTLSPGAVQERIHAINAYNTTPGIAPVAALAGGGPVVTSAGHTVPSTGILHEEAHPYFGPVAAALGGAFPERWAGARTTTQRWFADPVVNAEGVDRGLGIIFTHDHYGPSTHQQIGLYATVLAEPANSLWKHNETGVQLACADAVNPNLPGPSLAENKIPCRWDGGPTSWQAQIVPRAPLGGVNVLAETIEPFREFYFEYTDFQHAYEAGIYVGADQDGLALPGTGPGLPAQFANLGNPAFPAAGTAADLFRFAINPPARFQAAQVFPDLVVEANDCVLDPLNPSLVLLSRPCPQAIDVQDPGLFVVNYRNEPVGLRVFDPNKIGPDGKPGMQADGAAGDLALALSSNVNRRMPQLNVQPTAATVINGTKFPPPINSGGVAARDPFTPMARAYMGDRIRVKVQAGGDEEEHNVMIHGMKWLQAGSGHGRAPNSGWRNSQAAGISEQFTLNTPVTPLIRSSNRADYLYTMDASNDGFWSGMWGVIRSHSNFQNTLSLLPGSLVTPTRPLTLSNQSQFNGSCPVGAPTRRFDVTAVLANRVLPNAFGVPIPAKGQGDPIADNSVGAGLNPLGGTLVYNPRADVVGGQTIVDPETSVQITLPANRGPIHDPTAMMYVLTSDLEVRPAAELSPAQKLLCAAGGVNNPLCPVRLKATAPVEPLVLRAKAGECVNVTLRSRLEAVAPDLASYSSMMGVVKRDRFDPEGSTTFQPNLIRPSSLAGLHPQLVAHDVTRDDGVVVGLNPTLTQVSALGLPVSYRWYMGDVSGVPAGSNLQLVATPVEFGGFSLAPADKIKQGAKSLVGAMVVEPSNTVTITQNTQVPNRQGDFPGVTPRPTRLTRTQATITAPAGSDGSGGTFRDFSLVLTKALTQYYTDNATGRLTPVEHMNGEGDGIPEDSQEASGMALNYGIEPMWFRFGILPQAPFGGAGTPASYGSIPNAHQAFSNVLTAGQDPVTPVFQATAGQQARIRITNPFGTSRGSTFALHGHVWQRDPYVCDDDQYGLDGRCITPPTGSSVWLGAPLVGSRAIGNNPQGFAQGGQESWTPMSHFDIVLPSAGGGNDRPGDYLFRDQASFGSASGLWGILRVNP
ncbi:MAG: hypothetical protein HZB86_06000 [Deltaproteobacteria bacterium]|nr:hypothetical protein [Deltaproteobacteria bacterium]